MPLSPQKSAVLRTVSRPLRIGQRRYVVLSIEDIEVVTLSTEQRVDACPADQCVVALSSVEEVRAPATRDAVVLGAT